MAYHAVSSSVLYFYAELFYREGFSVSLKRGKQLFLAYAKLSAEKLLISNLLCAVA